MKNGKRWLKLLLCLCLTVILGAGALPVLPGRTALAVNWDELFEKSGWYDQEHDDDAQDEYDQDDNDWDDDDDNDWDDQDDDDWDDQDDYDRDDDDDRYENQAASSAGKTESQSGQNQSSKQNQTEKNSSGQNGNSSKKSAKEGAGVTEDGTYTSKDEVAAYLHEFGHLPSNYITKKNAKKLGWDNSRGNLDEVAPGKSIGGDYFGNYEGALPEKKGRDYYECDIDYEGGYRGAKRIIFSNDGLIYYTEDHYNTFEQLY